MPQKMENIFLQIFNMSMVASFVIIAVMLLRLPLKKAPKSISYALWGVVLFRLVCPFSFESIISLLPINPSPIGSNIMYDAQPRLNTGIQIIDNSVAFPSPQTELVASINPMQVFVLICAVTWIIGIIVLLCYSVISYWLLKRKVGSAILLQPQPPPQLYDKIFESERVSSPFVLGIVKPKIYLPLGLSDKEREYIIAHERYHIKRLDYLIKPIAFLVLCVHWFNPLAWAAFVLMTKDMELSCDEAVLKKLGSDIKREYSGTLLSLAVPHGFPSGSPLAFGESNVKARIKNVLSYKKPAFWIVITAVIAAVAVSVCFIANPKKSASSVGIIGAVDVSNRVMTRAELPNGFNLELVLIKGQTFSDEDAALSGNVYKTNFQGEYELRVLKENKVISKIQHSELLPISFDGVALNFDGKFELALADYNGDGDIDFTLGQWAGSNGNVFMLFSVDDSGSIRRLKIDGNEAQGILYAQNQSFSGVFDRPSDTSFTFGVYDVSIGHTVMYNADWNGSEFVISFSPEGFLDEISKSFEIKEGVARFTIPGKMPDGYDASQLSVHVSGSMPIGDDTNMSLHAFEKEEEEGSWELGKEYTEKILGADVPDKTEVYASFYLTEKGTDGTSKYNITVSKVFPLRPDHYTPSATVTASGQNQTVSFSNKFNDKLTLEFVLPKGWSLKAPASGGAMENGRDEAIVIISEEGENIGTIHYNDFKLHRDDKGEIPYMSVYNTIMLGSVASWDSDYTEISKTKDTCTAICKPFHKVQGEGKSNAELEETYNKGVLSYDANSLKYIAIGLDNDALTEEQLIEMAKSVKLSGVRENTEY